LDSEDPAVYQRLRRFLLHLKSFNWRYTATHLG
jgi:hypothetical protein